MDAVGIEAVRGAVLDIAVATFSGLTAGVVLAGVAAWVLFTIISRVAR